MVQGLRSQVWGRGIMVLGFRVFWGLVSLYGARFRIRVQGLYRGFRICDFSV
jgi:hypothetical protein